jgi:hypothetical protein
MSDLEKINQPSVTSALIELSKNPDIDPQKIEQLMNLQLKMEDRQAEKSFNQAMADFQQECPIIKKTKAVKNKDGTTRYTHAVLDEMIFVIKPILGKHGLSHTFNTRQTEDKKTELVVLVSHKDGFSREYSYVYDSLDDGGAMNSSQRRKSALTYAKRAALENALGIVTAGEDDDAKRALDNPASQEQIDKIKKLIASTGSKEGDLLFYLGLDSMESLSDFDAKKAINALNQKRNIASAKKKV